MVFLFSSIIYLLTQQGTQPDKVVVPPLAVAARDDASTNAAARNPYQGSVLIVGAGTAGLFAAYTLDFLGHDNYTILEASSRIGGRVQETPSFVDVPLDLGAEYIHAHPQVLSDLLLYDNNASSNIQIISYQPQTYNGFLRGSGRTNRTRGSGGGLFRPFRQRRNGKRRRHFWRHFYREYKFFNTTWYSYLNTYVAPYVQDRIQYNTVVKTIDTSNPNVVTVTTSDGQAYRAERVVVTIPLAVVPKVQFIPPLPLSKQKAINSTYMAPGVKVLIEFSRQFYSDISVSSTERYALAGSILDFDGDNEVNYDAEYFNAVFRKPTRRHVLTYFNVGRQAEAIVKQTDDEILSQVLAELDDMYDGQATQYYLQHVVQNWNAVPYIHGAYTLDWTNDFEATVSELTKPVANNRVYFAGEHTHADYVATVHGAALSGRRVAEDLWQEAASKRL